MEYDAFDLAAIEDWLLVQLSLVRKYQKHCERDLKRQASGTAKMERLKAIVMKDHLNLQLQKVQSLKTAL